MHSVKESSSLAAGISGSQSMYKEGLFVKTSES